MGSSKEELKLRCAQCWAQRTGDPGVLQSAFLGMPGASEFCTRDPHHEGAEVFGSQKQKSLVLKSRSMTHPLELMKRLIGLIPFIFQATAT